LFARYFLKFGWRKYPVGGESTPWVEKVPRGWRKYPVGGESTPWWRKYPTGKPTL